MWIDKYEKLMFSDTNASENIVQAVQLKYDNMPEIFYKYRNINTRTLDAFRSDTLYFSSISSLNDPYECALMLSYSKIKEDTYKSIFRQIKPFLKTEFVISSEDIYWDNIIIDKILSGLKIQTGYKDQIDIVNMLKSTNDSINSEKLEMEKDINLIANELYRLCSFSEIMDSKLMWSHYADQHKGFCIGYNFKEIDDDIRQLMLPIIYGDKILDITNFLFPITNNSLIMNAMSRKSMDWSYEREWRILISANNKQQCQPQKVPVAKAVYLGCRISQEDKIKIVDICKSKSIDVYQMKMRTDEFKLYSEVIID